MKLNNKTRVIIEKVCRYLGYINPIVPKNKKKIFIYNSTPSYQNNYAIYNYLIENNYNKDYKIVYYMPEANKYIKQSENIILGHSLKGALYHFLTSKFVFFDTGNMRIKPSKKQNVMNLWHGVPFKRIGFMSKTADKDMPKDLMNTFSKIILPNSGMRDVYKQSFLLSDNQYLCTGQPRNDLLKKNIEPFEQLGISKNKYSKVIMWMTTYRISKDERLRHTSNEEWSKTGLPLLIDQEVVEELSKELKKNNILLIIKQHTTGKMPEEPIVETDNIKIIEEEEYLIKGLQLYDILGKCDGLVTDYSSVFIDYLILNRPIGFVVNDIKDYEENNGFNFDEPLNYMPGEKLLSLSDIFQFFENIKLENDDYEDKRTATSDYFNEYHTEDNCKYILDSMGI